MAAEKFNSLTGYSVSIPAVDVVDANGNVITNVVAPSGNVTANRVYANYYFFANGSPFTSDPAGANSQIQFNNSGAFGASANFRFNTTTQTVIVSNFAATGNSVDLGDVENLHIDGGENGFVLQTDGTGNLSWTSQTGNGGGNGAPGGANMQVQFNNAGLFGGDPGFFYDKDVDLLTVGYIKSDAGNLTNIPYANINGIGNVSSVNLDGNSQNVLYGNGLFAGIAAGATANYANFAGNVIENAQPNITSVGTLTSLDVATTIQTQNLSANGNIGADGIAVTGNSIFNGPVTISTIGNLTSFSNVNFTSSPNVSLTVANLRISGGLNGYVLSTDGNGNVSWVVQGGGGGGGSPGGANTQIQFNDAGSFNGSPFMTFNKSTNKVTMAGELSANVFTVGSGAFEFRTTKVCFANTTSTSNVELCSTPVGDLSALNYVIVGTEAGTGKRQYAKFDAVYYDTTLSYNEISTLYVGGILADFDITYVPGDSFNPARIVLWVSPTTTNTITYKILIDKFLD
jgi:hypothetical protein